MKQQTLGSTSEELSRIIQGCMGLARDWDGDPNGEAAPGGKIKIPISNY